MMRPTMHVTSPRLYFPKLIFHYEVLLITRPILIGGWRYSRHFMNFHVATPSLFFFSFFENGKNKKNNTDN